jgi:energy-coupling factor transporter transmembrane protein EcfT
LHAALVQVLVAPVTLAAVYAFAHWHVAVPLYCAALLQGVLAALLTWVWGLAVWWRVIALVFPVALIGAHAIHVPPGAILAAFVVSVLLFWTTYRTQVPFYPSGAAAWQAVANLLPDRPLRLIDIGSGIGGLVLDLARRHPESELIGIEVAPLPWLLSVLRARLTRSTARFVRGDYERLDFADYDVVFAYLSPAAMPALWRKATREMRPATMLMSYEFSIAAKVADATVATTPAGPALYVWYF